MDPIKVVVIDDNIAFRSIIKEVISMEDDIQLAGEADNLEEAREVLLQNHPDVALLDISLDGTEGGLQFLKTADDFHVDFIILSAHNENLYSAKSLEAGAKGYVCKDKTVRCLADAIRSVHAGKEFVSSDC